MINYPKDLLKKAVLEIKDGNKRLGRIYLERSEQLARDVNLRAEICYWHAQVAEDKEKCIHWLKEALTYNPLYPEARRELAILQGTLKPDEIINPDKLPEQEITNNEVQAERFTCPNCGARMVYEANGRDLFCEHCGYQKSLAKSTFEDGGQDFFVGMATIRGHRKPVATQVFFCEGCGAQFILPPQAISAVCAYCGSTHVVQEEKQRDILPPNKIIPHVYSQKEVTAIFNNWLRLHKVIPDRVSVPLRGVYLPVWTFDLTGNLVYRLEENDALDTMSQTRMSYYLHFDDLRIPASKRVHDVFEKLLPVYDLSAAVQYEPGFLASWYAEVYDIPLADASLKAREMALKAGRRRVETGIPDVSIVSIVPADLQVISFKLVLLPVWITTMALSAKEFVVLIDGQNGEIASNFPLRTRGFASWMKGLLEN